MEFSDLEYARRHLAEQTDPKSRAMVMSGIDRLLDEWLDGPKLIIATPAETQAVTEGLGNE